MNSSILFFLFFFFFNDTATTEIYTLSLHDALPISAPSALDVRHLFHCRHVDAADAAVERDAAEQLDARNGLAAGVRKLGGRIAVVLQHEATHAPVFRQFGEVDGIDRPLGGV